LLNFAGQYLYKFLSNKKQFQVIFLSKRKKNTLLGCVFLYSVLLGPPPPPVPCQAPPLPNGSETEMGKVTFKSNGDEALSNEFRFKNNGDEALNDVFHKK
jgi:hypothetical protein